MSQPDRILRWLRARGSRGIHSFEFLREDPYGGPPMPRGADAIHRLKKSGVEIDVENDPRGRSHGVIYKLKAAGGDGLAPSRDARPVRDHTPPSGEVAAPPALNDQSAVRGGEHDGAPKPSSSTAREQGAGADTVPAAGPISLFGDEAEPEVEGSTSPYRVFEDAA